MNAHSMAVGKRMLRAMQQVACWFLLLNLCSIAKPAASADNKWMVRISYISVVGDKNEPLEAIAEKLPSETGKAAQRLGQTVLPKGELIPHPPIECAQGERLHVYVEKGAYLAQTVNCAPRILVTLTSWVTMHALISVSTEAERQQKYGLAALMDNDAAARLNSVPTSDLRSTLARLKNPPSDPKVPEDTSLLMAVFQDELSARLTGTEEAHKRTVSFRMWENMGKLLGYDEPSYFDPKVSKFIMTPEVKKAITDYQASNSLKPSGKLDYPTLKGFADIGVGDALTNWSATKMLR